jgi:hypothetical protein
MLSVTIGKRVHLVKIKNCVLEGICKKNKARTEYKAFFFCRGNLISELHHIILG